MQSLLLIFAMHAVIKAIPIPDSPFVNAVRNMQAQQECLVDFYIHSSFEGGEAEATTMLATVDGIATLFARVCALLFAQYVSQQL